MALRALGSRLVQMSGKEVWTRSRQWLGKRLDPALPQYRTRTPAENAHRADSHQASFFFDPADLPQLASSLAGCFPKEMIQTLEEAERICEHRFDLLGFRGLDYGPEVDWHLDAVHGKRAPCVPWYKIRYLDFDQVGDHKVIWELNRHAHLVTLAKAFWLARKERYITELLRQWSGWQRQNPYPFGMNWASSLEVAFRSLSWLWVKHLLTGCSAVPSSFELELSRALALNARHIERYLSTYFSPNTHLIGEAVALFFVGTLCPQFRPARRWRQSGWAMILREAERQVQPDGMHFERSTYYHVYALDFFLHARVLAARNGATIPATFDQTLERMLEVLCALSQAGSPPLLGDDDGGRVFNPRRNRAEHLLDPLATGAVLFGREDFKSAAGGLREETLWLLGPRAMDDFERIAAPERRMRSIRLESSGICVLADSEPSPRQLVIDSGSQELGKGGHSHADALSIQLTISGREWMADPGTLCYICPGPERDAFRGTAAHNTLQVDGAGQAEASGPFAWRSLPKTSSDLWVTGETFDLFAGSHDGYARLPQPVRHQRWVFSLKSRFWFVRDVATGEGLHNLEVYWHLAPEFAPECDQPDYLVFSSTQHDRLAFLPVRDGAWSKHVSQGRVSRVYGREEPSSVLVFKTRTRSRLPAEFGVLLLAGAESREGLAPLERLGEDENPPVSAYTYKTRQAVHIMVFGEQDQSWRAGPLASDARFLYGGFDMNEGWHWVLCGASYLEIRGERALAFKIPVARFEWVTKESGTSVHCSDESSLAHLSERVLASDDIMAMLAGLPSRKLE